MNGGDGTRLVSFVTLWLSSYLHQNLYLIGDQENVQSGRMDAIIFVFWKTIHNSSILPEKVMQSDMLTLLSGDKCIKSSDCRENSLMVGHQQSRPFGTNHNSSHHLSTLSANRQAPGRQKIKEQRDSPYVIPSEYSNVRLSTQKSALTPSQQYFRPTRGGGDIRCVVSQQRFTRHQPTVIFIIVRVDCQL